MSSHVMFDDQQGATEVGLKCLKALPSPDRSHLVQAGAGLVDWATASASASTVICLLVSHHHATASRAKPAPRSSKLMRLQKSPRLLPSPPPGEACADRAAAAMLDNA